MRTKVFLSKMKWEKREDYLYVWLGMFGGTHVETQPNIGLAMRKKESKKKKRENMGFYCLMLGKRNKSSMYFISSSILRFSMHVKLLLNYEHSKSKTKNVKMEKMGKWRWFEHKSLWKYFV